MKFDLVHNFDNCSLFTADFSCEHTALAALYFCNWCSISDESDDDYGEFDADEEGWAKK